MGNLDEAASTRQVSFRRVRKVSPEAQRTTTPGVCGDTHPPWIQREQRRKVRGRDRYPKPTDEFDEEWDLQGAVDDLRLLFEVGYRLAQEQTWPTWRDRNEFRRTSR